VLTVSQAIAQTILPAARSAIVATVIVGIGITQHGTTNTVSARAFLTSRTSHTRAVAGRLATHPWQTSAIRPAVSATISLCRNIADGAITKAFGGLLAGLTSGHEGEQLGTPNNKTLKISAPDDEYPPIGQYRGGMIVAARIAVVPFEQGPSFIRWIVDFNAAEYLSVLGAATGDHRNPTIGKQHHAVLLSRYGHTRRGAPTTIGWVIDLRDRTIDRPGSLLVAGRTAADHQHPSIS